MIFDADCGSELGIENRIILSLPERRELTRWSRKSGGRVEDVRRARIVLALASGCAGLREIARRERCSVNTMSKWRDRFLEGWRGRISALFSRHKGSPVQAGSERFEARISNWTLHRKPGNGSTQWSCRKLAKIALHRALGGKPKVGSFGL